MKYYINVKFEDLKQGDTFTYGLGHYMKVDSDIHEYNAVYLEGKYKGWLCFISNHTKVNVTTEDRRSATVERRSGDRSYDSR